jgi:hypothetical protein
VTNALKTVNNERAGGLPIPPRLNALYEEPRWLMVWTVDQLGECSCVKGSWHRTPIAGVSIGGPGECESIGKHPATPRGARDALSRADAVAKYKLNGRRRWAYTLQDLILIDIDSEQALQSFYRIAAHLPEDKIIGVAKTPRGWHLLLDVPGWNQRALNAHMRQWLGDWHGTDKSKVGRRGILLDVRTGAARYAVWPETRDRRWVTLAEFTAALQFAGRGMPSWRMVADGSRAPWNLAMTDELRARIAKVDDDPPQTVSASDAVSASWAWKELDHWCQRLEQMPPESGRNNALNRTAFLAGRQAIQAGWPTERVENRLRLAAARCQCPGAEATIRSGLGSSR